MIIAQLISTFVLAAKYNPSSYLIKNVKPLSIFGCTVQFVHDMVGYPEDRLSHDAAPFICVLGLLQQYFWCPKIWTCIVPLSSQIFGRQQTLLYLPKIQTKWPNHRVFHQKDAVAIANSEDPDQTAPLGAVGSGSALLAQIYLSENLGSL